MSNRTQKTGHKIWHNGQLVAWEDATLHVMSHALHYGSSVFEGIRAYSTPKGPAIFRLNAHLQRLFDSARLYRMQIPFTEAEISAACHQVMKVNGLKAAYLRPIVYLGAGQLGVVPSPDTPVEVAVAGLEWGPYLGDDALEAGVDCCVSSWTRLAPNTIPTMAKAGGNYLSSQLIAAEARRHGYVEAIALDTRGFLSEGPGENVFVIKDGVIHTTPLAASILPGITRDSVIALAQDLGYVVQEHDMLREFLYLADEIFFTGTAAEITPIKSVDGLDVGDGKRGPLTAALQRAFFGLFNGETEDTHGWLELVG